MKGGHVSFFVLVKRKGEGGRFLRIVSKFNFHFEGREDRGTRAPPLNGIIGQGNAY